MLALASSSPPAFSPIAQAAQPRASPSPLRLPSRSQEITDLTRTFNRGLVWTDDASASAWAAVELSVQPIVETPAGRPWAGPEGVALRTALGSWLLEDGAFVACATGVQVAPASNVAARDGLLRLACAHWPALLADALGGVPAPAPFPRDHDNDDRGQMAAAILTLVDRTGGRQAFPLRASAQTLLACAQLPGWRPMPSRQPMPAAVSAIVLAGGLWLDRLSIPAAQLSALRPGDALWLPPKGRSESSPLCLISGSQILHLGHVCHLTREFQGWGPEGGRTSNSLHAFPPSTEPRNVDALTVDLDFIVGRVAMTVGELSALAAGQVIPIEALTPARVRIVAHGTELGHGHLVEVEGRLAVEVLGWGTPR